MGKFSGYGYLTLPASTLFRVFDHHTGDLVPQRTYLCTSETLFSVAAVERQSHILPYCECFSRGNPERLGPSAYGPNI